MTMSKNEYVWLPCKDEFRIGPKIWRVIFRIGKFRILREV